MRTVISACAVFLLAGLLYAEASGTMTAFRTWTSATGATVEARLTGVEDGQALLETVDGRPLVIALANLSAADAERVAKMADAAAPAVETGPHKLPVFTTGPGAGYHAVYQHANFDARIDADGVLHVQLKEKGSPLDNTIRFVNHSHFLAPEWTHRPIREFQTPSPPVMQPTRVTFQGKFSHDVSFEWTYAFSGNVISAWGRCEDPKDVVHPTQFRIGIYIPPSHAIPKEVPYEEWEGIVQGYQVHMREMQGSQLKWVSYTYYESRDQPFPRIREARVEAPNWAPRSVQISTPSREAPLQGWVYSGYSLWQGYYFFLTKPTAMAKSRSNKDRMVLTID